jgi:hypothetical protein
MLPRLLLASTYAASVIASAVERRITDRTTLRLGVPDRFTARSDDRIDAADMRGGAECVGNTPAQATFPGSNGKIAFSLCCAGTGRDGEIWTVKPNGSDPTRLTKNLASDEHAAWRPDGKKIAFVSWTDWSNTPIVVMNPDGSNKEQISGSQVSYGLTWSSDGRKMAFERRCHIYVMNADGSGDPTRLTTDPNDCAVSPD